jgi:uncharacterized protein
MRVLEIDLLSIPAGRTALETDVGAADLDLSEDQYHFAGTVSVLLDVERGGEEIVFRGTVAAPATVECSRCLTHYEDTVSAPFSLIVHRVDADSPMLRDSLDEEGIRFVPRSATSVELTDEVRSVLILALPISPVCRPDCRGLCAVCGGDLNQGDCGCAGAAADPRWSALDALRQRKT